MHNPTSEPTRNPSGPDYSDRDIPVGKILLFAFYTALFTVVTFVGLRMGYKALDRSARKSDEAVSAFVRETRVLPPEPRLLVDEPVTWARERARQDAQITGYAWVDPKAGVVRIPVARAIELLAERGLPARQEPPAP